MGPNVFARCPCSQCVPGRASGHLSSPAPPPQRWPARLPPVCWLQRAGPSRVGMRAGTRGEHPDLGSRGKPYPPPGVPQRGRPSRPPIRKVGRGKWGDLGAASKRASWKRGPWARPWVHQAEARQGRRVEGAAWTGVWRGAGLWHVGRACGRGCRERQ